MVEQTVDSNDDVKADEAANENETAVVEEAEVSEASAQEDDQKDHDEPEVVAEKAEEDFKEKFYYLAAEMDNMKRRFDKEKDSLIKFGNEKVLSGLIEVVDNLDRTLDALVNDEDEKVKNIVTGVEMVRTQFLEVLKNNGLERLDSVGEIFDPNFHEALSQQAAEGKKEQEIIQEFQKGYVLNGRLLRAAKVVIAKND